jgi:hypothetical protein
MPARLLHSSQARSDELVSAESAQPVRGHAASEADVYELPDNVHLLTMKQLGPRKLMVRLAHLFQVSHKE